MSRGSESVYIIAGPTASGKSALAMEMAATKDGVIVNADSLQIYDALPLLTAQPSSADKVAVPHALYGVLDPGTACSAGNWQEMAVPAIESILDRGQTPIVTGGSGLYLKALMEGLSPIPDIPDDIRAQAVVAYETMGENAFYSALQKRDPVMAARLHPGHKARLIRAWEVLEATGRYLAQWQEIPPTPPPAHWRFMVTLVMPPRAGLYDRCNRRFDQMMASGALEEVRRFDKHLSADNGPHGAPVTKALGFRLLQAALHGDIPLDEAVTQAKAQTRHFAKRQVTWFRHQITADRIVESP
ncbi:MAG: tRNA (adenosine(37)-N6)-dimethylallyltransferase MiaA [Alphaproteobacteria bacterium]|nr:tRNA (adenosine(37)-N6)-dimethylallyltransferase MiaA [Alphaproteobacteria bacterium]